MLALARAQVATARSHVQEAIEAHSRAKFNHDYWKSQSERFDSLVKDGVLTKQSREETRNQFESAASALSEAKAKVASANAVEKEKVVARKKAMVDIRAAEAAQQTQAELVGYATLKAPFDGVVTQKSVSTQQFVQPATGGKGDVLYVIEKTDKVRIFAAVPETDAGWVGVGMTATVRVRGLPRQGVQAQGNPYCLIAGSGEPHPPYRDRGGQPAEDPNAENVVAAGHVRLRHDRSGLARTS